MTQKLLVAITTYDAYAYVDLSLTQFRRFGAPCIVLDDGSHSEKLRDVCARHRVYLSGRCKERERTPGKGDLLSTANALRYADHHGYEYLLKVSRRWICLADPLPSLAKLIETSGGSTFSNYTSSYDYGFRTEFICYHIPSWRQALEELEAKLAGGEELLVESFIHQLARKVEPSSDQYKHWLSVHPAPPDRSGYVRWPYMGNDRRCVPPYILWHDSHTPAHYLSAARSLGLKYDLPDFEL